MDQNIIKWGKIANKLRRCSYQIACNSTAYNHRKMRIVSTYCADTEPVIYGLVQTYLRSTTQNVNENLINWRKLAKKLRRYTYKIAYDSTANDPIALRIVANDC